MHECPDHLVQIYKFIDFFYVFMPLSPVSKIKTFSVKHILSRMSSTNLLKGIKIKMYMQKPKEIFSKWFEVPK